jgi:hypothetical protein
MTDLFFFVAVQEPGHSVSLLRVDLLLDRGMPDVVVAAVC